MCFLQGVGVTKYKGLWMALKNDNLLANYSYPYTTTLAYEIICKYRGSARGQSNKLRVTRPDVKFTYTSGNNRGNSIDNGA